MPEACQRRESLREKGWGAGGWKRTYSLSPQLDHATTRHVVGLVECVTRLLASIACSDEFGDERVVELAAQGFLPLRRRWRHVRGERQRNEDNNQR